MKKLTFLLALMLLTALGAQAGEKKVYTSYNSSTKTLTYYYDDQYGSRAQVEYYPVNTRWVDYSEQVISGKVDASMKNAPLTSMRSLFRGHNGTTGYYCYLSNMTSITGLDNLNTAIVTNMSYMFEGCSSLTELNLSSFNTSNVTSMNSMFEGCSSLTKLNLSSFNTTNVTDMSFMFRGCKALTSLNLSSFNTANVTTMGDMFYRCESLTSLDLSGFNTSNVTNMYDMFYTCYNLQSLDISSFNTSKVTNMGYMFTACRTLEEINVDNFDISNADIDHMFFDCISLKTIYCSHDWSSKTGTDMFLQCFKLVGGNGTAYSSDKRMDAYFARPDGGPSSDQPGYFTKTPKVYTVFDGNETLTYYYNNLYDASNPNHTLYDPESTEARWTSYYNDVQYIVLDASMDNAPLTSLATFFYGGLYGNKGQYSARLANVKSISGLEYLHTENVTDMSKMFFGLSSVPSFDLRTFTTDKVETMSQMFRDCSSITSLDLSHFKTDVLWDTYGMFLNCSALTTIYCDEDWGANPTLRESTAMFKGCNALVGGNGTKYNESKVKATYAHLDGGESNPGYFTSSTATGIEDVQSDNVQCTKVMVDGVLYLMHEGRMYDVRGAEVR